MSKKYNRSGGALVTPGYIQGIKENYPKEYSIPKYLQLCERAINMGFEVWLYKPVSGGVSKYVTVKYKNKRYKIRFSNHKPIKSLEVKGTCDFFVGVTNLGVSTTEDAWRAMMIYFGLEKLDG
jgi:hypothetical protein